VKSANRLIPVRPFDCELICFPYKKYYFNKALHFGASLSCITFERFASFFKFCVKLEMKSGKLIYYLDDLLGGNKTPDLSIRNLSHFEEIFAELLVPIAHEKTQLKVRRKFGISWA
jgi:hypothetical protein